MEYLKGASSQVGSGLTHKHQTELVGRLARYKHSSLFGLVVSNEEKKFYKIDTRCGSSSRWRCSRPCSSCSAPEASVSSSPFPPEIWLPRVGVLKPSFSVADAPDDKSQLVFAGKARSLSLRQLKRISCKHNTRWQHLSRLKVSAFLSLQKNSC